MTSDPARAGLALLCLLAIGLAGAQFPAIGMGDTPDGGGPLAAEAGVAEQSQPSQSTEAVGRESKTSRPTDEESPTQTPTEEPTASDPRTPTRTSTETEEPTAIAGESGGNDGIFLGGHVLAFLVVSVGVLIAITLGVKRRSGNRRWGTVGRTQTRIFDRFGSIGGLYSSGESEPLVQRISRATMSFVVAGSAHAPRVFAAMVRINRAVIDGVKVIAGGITNATVDAALAGPNAFGRVVSSAGRGLALSFLSTPTGAKSLFGGLVKGRSSAGSIDRPDTDGREAGASIEEAAEPDPPATIAEAWDRLMVDASIRDRRAKTPVESARAVIRAGRPTDPVIKLLTLFRQWRYGNVPTSRDRLEAARGALERVRGGEDS